MRSLLLLLGATVSVMVVSRVTAPPTIVGVLEQPPQCSAESRGAAIHPAFIHGPSGWRALDARASAAGLTLPKNWRLTFDGRDLGAVAVGEPPVLEDDWFFRRDFRLVVLDAQSLPHHRVPDRRFDGSCTTISARPLVAVANGHATDPEQWKPYRPTANQIAALTRQFARTVGTVYQCSTEDAPELPLVVSPSRLGAASGYRNREGSTIVGLQLTGEPGCGDIPTNVYAWDVHWFSVRDGRYLGRAMWLIDAGDYDGDGSSELVFWINNDEENGFAMLSEHLRRYSELRWVYH